MADRTSGEHHALAVRLEHRATQNSIVRSYGIMPSSRPEDDDTDREAAALLRRQAEQLDTLRAAIGDPENLRLLADTFDLPILRRIAAAVPQDPEEGRA